MFVIRDGRENFFQWDLNQQLLVLDNSITEVHFCNKLDCCALIVEVKEDGAQRYADVPNIVLQSSFPVRAYAYCTDHTIKEQKFKVLPRSKPADYIYTETEVKNYEAFEERLAALEDNLAIDLTEYAKKSDIPTDYLTEIPSEYVTEAELEAKGYLTEHQDISGKLDKKTTNRRGVYYADGTGAQGLLPCSEHADSYTVPYRYTGGTLAVGTPTEDKHATTKAYVDNAINNIDIPTLDGYATEQFVTDAVGAITIPTVPTEVSAFNNDSGYQTKEQVDTAISAAIADIPTSGGSTGSGSVVRGEWTLSDFVVDGAQEALYIEDSTLYVKTNTWIIYSANPLSLVSYISSDTPYDLRKLDRTKAYIVRTSGAYV